jgi:acyl-homoserine-lactone acylase
MFRVIGLVALWASLLAAVPSEAAYRVSIRRTAHGIAHIRARDFPSLGYGYGFAAAQDNICVLADTYVTVRAERSRFFGPDAGYPFRSNGTNPNNLNSDFFYRRIIDQKTVERLIAEPPPAGPAAEIKQAVTGFVAGYNEYLRRTGVDHIPDAACRGKEWVRPIEEIDAYRRFYQLALLASSGVAIDGIGGAQPPAGSGGDEAAAARAQQSLAEMDPTRFDALLGIGSNAYGLGKEATASGHGMVLGNPHFPWDGAERFWQSHLTIPGKIDVQGASLFGVPVINIGNTRGMAWSHTVSTARRFTPFQLQLATGDPTSYMVDGQARPMKATKVTVQARTPDGKLEPRTRTLYETHHGPILTSILGLPVFPWTSTTAFAMGDVNAANFRYLNHFFYANQAQSVAELDAIERRYLGIPWVNTIAADSTGKAYYADIGAVPNVSNEMIQACSVPVGRATDAALRLQVLDGSRTSCEWGSDPDAIKPGIFGPSHLPSLFRDDYVTNSNDSYWLSNPAQPLEGFSRVIGDERTTRAPRTRLGLRIVQQRLDGSDGLPGKRFTLRQLQDAVFNNRQYLGELWRDELVAMCKSSPVLPGSRGPVDVSAACPVLEKWDLHDDLDSRGAILFRRFATRANSTGVPVSAPPPASPFRDPFDPDDPVNTPRGLNTGSPLVQQALADAVTDLRAAGIPLDAPLRDFQYEMRGDEKIPIHGGPGTVGVFNAINVGWDAAKGYPNVPHGSSYVQAVELTGGCPDVRTILTYSQSTNPQSQFFGDQTRLFSRKQWVDIPFCDDQLARAGIVSLTEFGGGVALPGEKLLSRVRVRGRVVSFRLSRRATVTIRARGMRTIRRRLGAGTHRIRLRGKPRRVRVTARAA